ncbi:unnamed protein product, partial [Coffea canephora]
SCIFFLFHRGVLLFHHWNKIDCPVLGSTVSLVKALATWSPASGVLLRKQCIFRGINHGKHSSSWSARIRITVVLFYCHILFFLQWLARS